ncbi:MAG: hypothetical protein J6N19_09140 [Clostridium sp.]|nr:hypothetical protein [Clostridium sp.]
MTYQEVNTMLEGIGLPFAYNQFDNDTPQVPPFICFLYDDSNDLKADNINYSKIRGLSIELYTNIKDFALEQLIEQTLTANELPYFRSETWLESEKMYMIVYDTEIVITEGE